MDITISASSCADDTYLPWDTVWNSTTNQGNWALAEPDELGNIGGLRAKAAIATAVIIALMTDKACPTDHPLYKFCDGDPRGWWGDAVLMPDEDGPIGSLLWLLERSVVKAQGINMAQWAESFALDALAIFVTRGVCAQVTASAEVFPQSRGLSLEIALIGDNGQNVYSGQFDVLWQQVRGGN